MINREWWMADHQVCQLSVVMVTPEFVGRSAVHLWHF